MLKCKLMKYLFILLLFVAVVNPGYAQDAKWTSGNSLSVSFPMGTMADTYDLGLGIYGNIDYHMNKLLALRFDLGWNRFSGSGIVDPNTGLTEDIQQTIWEITAGVRLKLAVFYIEGRGGYFTGVSSFGVVPAVGLRLGKFDIQGNMVLAGNDQWAGVRLGYYWVTN